MSLKSAEEIESGALLARVGIELLECDICHSRFSATMTWAWPFCLAGIPHQRMESKKQLKYLSLLEHTPERPTNQLVHQALKLYGPTMLSISCEETNIPNMPNLPTITLTREKLREWSDRYKIMGEFIGNVIGKRNWGFHDLIEYSKRWEETPA